MDTNDTQWRLESMRLIGNTHIPSRPDVFPSDHFGIITIHNDAGTFVLRRPDFKVSILNSHTLPVEAVRAGSDETAYYQQYIMSKYWEHGGVPGLKSAHLGHCAIGTVQSTNCPPSTWQPTDTGELDAFQILDGAVHFGTDQIPPLVTLPPRNPRPRR